MVFAQKPCDVELATAPKEDADHVCECGWEYKHHATWPHGKGG